MSSSIKCNNMEKLMGLAKDNVKMGVLSMGGHGILGSMGSIPSMPGEASTAGSMASTGLNLASLGMVAKTGLGIVEMPNMKKFM